MANVNIVQGMDFGIGIDSLGGKIRGNAVTIAPIHAIPGTGEGQEINLVISQVESQDDLNRALSISADVSAGFSFFGGDAKFEFAQQCQYHNYSVWLVAHISVQNAFQQMNVGDVQLKPDAVSLLSNGQEPRFREQFGDLFVLGVQTGGEVSVVLEIVTTSESDSQSVHSAVSGSGVIGTFPVSASVQVTNSLQQSTMNHTTNLYINQSGGDPLKGLNISTLVDQLFGFADSVKTIQNKSVAYIAFLQDYKVLDLPFEPNWVDLSTAQENISMLMRNREAAVTLLNEVNYVLLHPDQFPDRSPSLSTSVSALTDYINTVTQGASNIVNNPKVPLPTLPPLPNVDLPKRIQIPPVESSPPSSGSSSNDGSFVKTHIISLNPIVERSTFLQNR